MAVSKIRYWEALGRRMKGELILPGDSTYDEHRRVWNLDVDRFPAAIARCVDEDDVRAAVRFATSMGIDDVAVRGGGHSYPGLSTCDNGLVIDLGLMHAGRIGDKNRVSLQGGALLGHLDKLTAQIGTAVPAGVEATTGVAGLTLGGGVGILKRRFGLTCDSLRAVRIITADGDLVVADDNTEPELMWGLRGGGGNFGIVTEFEFQSHPIGEIQSTMLVYPLDRLAEFAAFFDEYMPSLPNDMSSCTLLPKLEPDVAQIVRGVDAAPIVNTSSMTPGDYFAVSTVWVGRADKLAEVLAPLEDFKPVGRFVQTFAHLDAQSRYPELGLPQSRYVRGGYLDSVRTGALLAGAEALNEGRPRGIVLQIAAQGGAVSEVGENDSAFSSRAATYMYSIEASWSEPSKREATVGWVREAYDPIERYATGGNYTNIVTDEGSGDTEGIGGLPPRKERVQAVFGDEKLLRLQRLKAAWDPKNTFHLNLNVKPDPAPSTTQTKAVCRPEGTDREVTSQHP